MPKYAYVALIVGGITLFSGSFTQQSPAAPSSPADSKQPLVGKQPIHWIISKKYWTNTRRPLWLGGLKGHVTVIEFFRINCSHCQEAYPSRRALYLKYAKRGLKMVSFQSPGDINDPHNEENDWSKVKRTVRKWGLPYPVAFDSKRALFDKYGLGLYPTILVLDKQGVVRFQQTGYTEERARQLDQFLAQALK